MEQLDFFEQPENFTAERKAYEIVRPLFMEVLSKWNLPEDSISIDYISNGQKLAVKCSGNVVCRYAISKNKKSLEIPAECYKYVPPELADKVKKLGKDFIKVDVTVSGYERFSPVLAQCLNKILSSASTTFSCCSHYMECSDKMRCIHPDKEFASGCFYKRNLIQGKCFYGVNKTC